MLRKLPIVKGSGQSTSGQTSASMQHDQARRTSIAIVGAGIGGLTAAACLLRAGFDVHVYGTNK